MGIREECKELTGFTVPSGHYVFNRLPFGLSNSPANFQRLMDTVLKNLVGTERFLFIDDIIVFSSSAEEHARDYKVFCRDLIRRTCSYIPKSVRSHSHMYNT